MKKIFCVFICVYTIPWCYAMQPRVASGNARVICVWDTGAFTDRIVRDLIDHDWSNDQISFVNQSREKLKAVCTKLHTYCENFRISFSSSSLSLGNRLHLIRLYNILLALQIKLAGIGEAKNLHVPGSAEME